MDLFISSFKTIIILIKAVLRSFSCPLAMLEYLGPAVVVYMGSNGDILP